MAAKKEDVYHIYSYDFSDGSAYIGRTKQRLAARHEAHRNRPVNRYLYHQLQRHPDVKPVILSSHRDYHKAVEAERQALAALEKPLNAVWISTERFVPEGCNGSLADTDKVVWSLLGRTRDGQIKTRQHRRYSRAETGSFRCRTCLNRLPPAEFYSETGRSSGIASRCKKCCSAVNKIYRRAKLAGRDGTSSYHACVSAIRAGTIDALLDEYLEAVKATGYKPYSSKGKTDRFRDDGSVLCRLCQQYKPETEFYKINTLLGIDANCKACKNYRNRVVAKAAREGTSTSEAWQAATADIQEGRADTSQAAVLPEVDEAVLAAARANVPEGKYFYGYHKGFNYPVYFCLPRTHSWQNREVFGDVVFVKVCSECGLEAQRLKGKFQYFLSGCRVW